MDNKLYKWSLHKQLVISTAINRALLPSLLHPTAHLLNTHGVFIGLKQDVERSKGFSVDSIGIVSLEDTLRLNPDMKPRMDDVMQRDRHRAAILATCPDPGKHYVGTAHAFITCESAIHLIGISITRSVINFWARQPEVDWIADFKEMAAKHKYYIRAEDILT